LAQYDTDLLIVKWMYGNATENVLNFTLYMRNVSDTSYTCIDATKNFFVWTVYKYDSFGGDWTQFFLAGLQNLLGNVLTINRYYGYIDSATKQGRTDVMWNIIGKITVLLVDFNAITISEIAGMDDDIALAPFNNSTSLNLSKIDMHTHLIELPQVEDKK
jgi:hypothetical protein